MLIDFERVDRLGSPWSGNVFRVLFAVRASKLLDAECRNWSVDINLIKTLHFTLIEIALLYCADVWGGALTVEQIKRLYTIQRIFLLKLLRPYRTTATQALNVLSGIPPLHLKAKHDFLKFQIWTCRSRGLDGLINLNSPDHHVLLSEIQLHTGVLNLNEKLDDNLFEVYTDGSKIAGGVVFSVCILKEEIQDEILGFKLDSHNAVFQAELAALGGAAAWAIKTNNKINIFTDSISSIDALKSHRAKSKFVNSIKEKFCLAEGLVGLAWVKAHVGIPGNELANHFAKLGYIDGKVMDIPLPYSFVKFQLNEKMMEEGNSHFEP
ncbi:hypothetical protein AVEN_258250-1 [Araneus ventricosus]|uniref:RNase H type-1 domain-containing protein n=1 Tax=Araneus ventricosus TaxID=182803 RepID=A0A4Y2M707_ARAVE|nr:hypothetical protein AVEN_258250-1 [Araneus ventricosus]